ncbi:MAG: pyridoxal phosphate-dependent aminotransferase [Chlorobi bacterium]|nr:pyridoxal phosphate-dependent aminotransferase [Chlorobiota bacterium]
MSISLIGRSLKESATLKLNEVAAILRAKGEPLIHLGIGEPQSRTPIEAVTSFTGILNSGEIRYTPVDGTREMKQAVIRYTEDYYNRHVQPENIIISSGAKQAIMVALQAILDPQDEVIFPSPYWVSYPEMVKLCGAVPVPVPAEDGSFYPRIEDIEQNLTGYTKAIIINSPNNPSGAVYAPQFIEDIIKLAEKESIYLIFDDIYNRLIFDGVQVTNPYDISTDDTDNSRLIVVNGISKPYAMTGFRIGWAVASRKLIEVMTNIQAHQTSGPSVLLQKAAIGAINGSQTGVESLRETLQNNTKVMIDQLKAFDGVHVSPPDGTFYVFADFSYYNNDSEKLAKFLLDKIRVVTVPGAEFGFDGYLRLSTCTTIKDITEGIERIKWALDPNSPNELYIGERKLVRDWL